MEKTSQPTEGEWIAIEPPHNAGAPPPTCYEYNNQAEPSTAPPPTFRESQFDVILRRQRMRPREGGFKFTAVPSRFLNLTNDFEFAGWGSFFRVKLTSDDISVGSETLRTARNHAVLGQFTASALAGNDILGGVFYTLPAMFAVSSVYSPISLFIATLTLFLWRPIMEELGSALPISGAPYTYLLNVSSKALALVGAALLLLDFASTAVISAATASSYLAGEVSLPFPPYVGAIIVFVIFTAISLCGLKESSRVAFGILALHAVTMIILIIASIVAWARLGSSQLKENWEAGQAASAGAIVHEIFNGICIGMLGLTGFECAPAYIAKIRPGRYPKVLRNLHLPAIVLNATMMLLVMALIPFETILHGDNILSLLAQKAAGRWLRLWVVIEAIIVLCAGVLTGILSACELLEQLSQDRVLPQVFLRKVPSTGAPHLIILSFIGFSGIIYASTGAQLSIISKMFSVVWLAVMMLFPLSLVLLRFSRPRLPRSPHTSMSIVFASIVVAVTVIGGNIAIDPTIAGYFAAYFIAIMLFFSVSHNKTRVLRWLYWSYDQYPLLHKWRLTRQWGERIIKLMTRLRLQPVCILVKGDEINNLFKMILYVCQNEDTSCLKIVHFHDPAGDIPSELEANAKILDEAFPEITIDLMLVDGTFEPLTVAALAHQLEIPRSLMFMSCPGPHFPYATADFGTRIISL
ncbi:amino acid permease-domain-containing protein [Hygrophoropsis aurantiaca]|uniref:Amino acid permease-domain-containing protein n=1 Tax=Hygrophoropsis aurantiaca TaxID=72124 RepID=A0ACB8ARW3_9AGAM|nr:amino acid permease-domain-containing protein [Hygrophoropsis aurantiaca]